MKTLNHLKIAFVLCLLLFCMSCEPREGQLTEVRGYVVNEFTGERLPNALVDIFACRRGIGQGCGTKDTVRSNAEGYYEYTFYNESGKSGYFVGLHFADKKYYNNTRAYEIRIGKKNNINVAARPFKTLKLNFRAELDADFKLFSMQIGNSYFYDTTGIFTNVDTTLYIPVIPNQSYQSTAYFRKRFIQEYVTKRLIFETTEADTTFQDFMVP